jgi:hypothetical protein
MGEIINIFWQNFMIKHRKCGVTVGFNAIVIYNKLIREVCEMAINDSQISHICVVRTTYIHKAYAMCRINHIWTQNTE